MSRLLLRRKPSIKSNVKPVPVTKVPKKESKVEFRWSKTATQHGLTETDSLTNSNLIDLDSSLQKVSLSSPSPTLRNLSPDRSSFSTEKHSIYSPRLPNINNNKEKELPTSTDEKNTGNTSPLSVAYSQLYQAQNSSQTKKTSQTQYSIYPLINDQRNSISGLLTNDKYIRLQTSQLRRLNVSNKYIKEAKKLYFNPTSKVFVPRHSIVQIS